MKKAKNLKITDMGPKEETEDTNVSNPQLRQSGIVTKNNNNTAETKTNQKTCDLLHFLLEYSLLSLIREDKDTY